MENKDQNPLNYSGGLEGDSYSLGTVHEAPADVNSLSAAPEGTAIDTQIQRPKSPASRFLHFARRLDVLLVLLLVIGGGGAYFTVNKVRSHQNVSSSTADSFSTIKIPLGDIVNGKNLSVTGASNVAINGQLQLNDTLTLTPSLQPTGAKPGQIYFDQTANQLAYFNGSNFVFLTSAPASGLQSLTTVEALGGANGQITLGSGLTIAGNQLSNSGVLSVQGQNGAVTLTAGPGIVINGTNFSNSGILSVASASPNVTVTSDGQGNVTVAVAANGTGTITSSGGTGGTIPLFTGAQNIEDSIITQSGLTVTISGDLSVVTGGLSLSNALTVPNGGTGATSLAANGVLVGQGTATISSVATGTAGLCLLSTTGVPAWGACPSGGGVNSLNSLTGALSIANASAAGTTITIDNASTTNKGIASFSGTNFTASGGNINTVQDINSAATPTFSGVNTNTITPNAALTVGVSAQTALLQGSTTTIRSNGAGNDIVLDSANAIDLQDNTYVSGDITTTGNVVVNGGSLTSSGALNITTGGALAVGSSSQALTLQGGATTSLRATSSGSTTIVAFTSPTANTTLNFPALAAGTYTICTTSGNCAGAGVTLQAAYSNSSSPEITLDATRGALTIRDNSTPIGGNLLEVQNNTGSATYLAVTSNGIAVSGTATVSGTINSSTGTLQTNSTTRIDNSGNLINIAAITAAGNATIQGGGLTVGTGTQAASIVLNDGSSNTGTLQVAALGQNTVYTLPDPGAGTATICLTTGNCAGTGGGVTTGGGSTNRLAKFTGSQAVGDSSITDNGSTVAVSVDVIVQGGDLTLGTTSQPASIILHDGNGQTTTLQAGDSTANLNFILPTGAGLANQCLKQSGVGNQLVWQDCDGGSGGSSATLQTAYNNSSNPEITLNNSVGGLTIRDNSTPLGANLFEIQNNAGNTTYLAVTVSGISVSGTATATGNVNSSTGTLQTNGTTRIDNSGNLVNIGNLTGSGPITIASIGAGNDITVDGADQFIVQDASVFNALATYNANIDVGANDIIGTTGNINLTNFDVVGSTGTVTAGTYNGQTISSSANFTGTVVVANNLTLTAGDIAVNGGDITSTGALNITPAGTLTVGVTGQQLVLQGSATTKLTATSGGFTTTVSFTGTPTANIAYNFDRAAAAGTYTICTTVGNCSGVGGGVTTSGGSTGTLPVFTGSQTLGDSLLSQSGGVVTVNGGINLATGNQYTINGTQISSANLSNDANLAKLGSSQTFTGGTNAFKNASNSTNAFNIQNAAGSRIVTADTTNAQVVLGTAGALDGALVFANMSNANTVTLLPGTPTANRTLTLPNASGIICTDSGNCAGAGATLQTGYNFSVGGTTPKIKLNSTLLGVDIQDADTTIGADLFDIRGSSAVGLGSVMFGVGNTGQVTLQNSSNGTAAFRLLTSGGTSVLTGDTTNGQIVLGQSGTLTGTLVFKNSSNSNTITLNAGTAPTANRTITLPNATGTICLSSGNCAGSGSSYTLQAAYDAGNTVTTTDSRDVSFTLADTSTDANFLVNLQCTTSCGSNGRFAVQNAATDVFAISPVNGATTFHSSANSTAALRVTDASNAAVLTVDTSNGYVGIGNLSAAYPLDVAGDANISSSSSYRIGGTAVCTSSGCTPASGSASYIQNQNAAAQTAANFWVSGSGRANTSFLAPTFDAALSATLNIGNTNATSINLGQASVNVINNGKLFSGDSLYVGTTTIPAGVTNGRITAISGNSTTITGVFRAAASQTVDILQAQDSAGACQWRVSQTGTVGSCDSSSAGSGAATFRSGDVTGAALNSGALTLKSGNSTSSGNTGTVTIKSGDATSGNSGNVIIDAGSASGTAGTITLGSANASAINLNKATTVNANFTVSSGLATLNGSTSGDALTVSNSSSTGNIAVFKDNATTVGTIADGGAVTLQNSTNSASALKVTNALNTSTVLDVDTQNTRVGIGTATPGYTLDVAGTANFSVGATTNAFRVQNGGNDLLNVNSSTNVITVGSPSLVTELDISGNVVLGTTLDTTQSFESTTFPPTGQGTWTTGGNANWSRTTTTADAGSASAASGTIADSQSTWLDFNYTFAQAGSLVFSWRADSEEGFDFLVFCVDNDAGCTRTSGYTYAISGSTGWRQTSVAVAAGAHSFRWLYGKDSSDANGSDKGWIDNIRFVTGSGTVQGTLLQFAASAGVNITAGGGNIVLGSADATGTLLVLDTKTTSGDPTGINGAMYYNSSAGKFRCYEASAWIDCISPIPLIHRYYATSAQLLNNNADTQINFPFTEQDDGLVTKTGDNVFTLNRSGIWEMTATMRFSSATGGSGERYMAICNAVTLPAQPLTRYANATTNGTGFPASLNVTGTDYITSGTSIAVYAYESAASAINTDPSWNAIQVSFTWLGP